MIILTLKIFFIIVLSITILITPILLIATFIKIIKDIWIEQTKFKIKTTKKG
jgi:hypothetical protein|nr:hypothetical protein [uncultured Mediterranean phage uvMED]